MGSKLVIFIVASILCCSMVYGNTLTFDDVPSGTVLHSSSYAYDHRVFFSEDFRATDHIGSAWGPPHSGSNVLTSVGNPYTNPFILFGRYTSSGADPDPIQSVDGYFSTEMGAMIRITAYHVLPETTVPVTSVIIGAPGESWSNRFVEINTSPDLPFEWLEFEGVNSPNDLLGFCADDMTITLVPEPSSLFTLAGGIGMLGFSLLSRRRR